MMDVGIHREDEMGNVFTLKNRHGLRISWNGQAFTIPRYFKSDGASVPRFFWRLVFPSSDTTALRAAFAHDYIYRTQPKEWTQEEADKMFFDLLIVDGMVRWRAWLAYIALRLFGWFAWKKNAAAKEGAM